MKSIKQKLSLNIFYVVEMKSFCFKTNTNYNEYKIKRLGNFKNFIFTLTFNASNGPY